MEYATPLQTLYLMSQDRDAGFGEKERKEQVLLFYRTLSQILENDLECRNRFRLVLINGELEKSFKNTGFVDEFPVTGSYMGHTKRFYPL